MIQLGEILNFDISMIVIRLIKRYSYETHSEVLIGKYLPETLPVQVV
jgi:hypothetical protein